MSPSLDRFLTTLSQCLPAQQWLRLTLSQPLPGAPAGLKSVSLRPVQITAGARVQCVLRSATSDETKTLTPGETIRWVTEQLGKTFAHADLYTTEADYFTKFFPKQNTWHTKRKGHEKTAAAAPEVTHNREKQRFLEPELPWLEDLGITDRQGLVKATMQDKWRQMNKFLETLAALTAPRDDGSSPLPVDSHVVDMGCGKAYLTFALYHFLTESRQWPVTVTGVDRRPELMASCQAIAQKYQMKGLSFVTSEIDVHTAARCDVLIALHACDTATDMALARGLAWNASLILVAPCCHKQVRRDMVPPALLLPMLQHGILLERQAEMVTDSIRALHLEARGYRTKIFEFISPEHTPKNVMITAEKVRRPANQQEKITRERNAEISALKATFGVQKHALEQMVAPT